MIEAATIDQAIIDVAMAVAKPPAVIRPFDDVTGEFSALMMNLNSDIERTSNEIDRFRASGAVSRAQLLRLFESEPWNEQHLDHLTHVAERVMEVAEAMASDHIRSSKRFAILAKKLGTVSASYRPIAEMTFAKALSLLESEVTERAEMATFIRALVADKRSGQTTDVMRISNATELDAFFSTLQ